MFKDGNSGFLLCIYGWHKYKARVSALLVLCNRLLYLASVIGDQVKSSLLFLLNQTIVIDCANEMPSINNIKEHYVIFFIVSRSKSYCPLPLVDTRICIVQSWYKAMVGQSTFDFPRVRQLTIAVLQKSKSDYENTLCNKITRY